MRAELVQKDEWDILGKSIAPEVYELVKDWDTLSSDRKGELSGYAIGKHGTDIFVPGMLAKVASKSLKSARELAAVCKNIKLANESLILEASTSIGNNATLKEIMKPGKTTAFLGEELSFSAKEITQLKKTRKLEASPNNAFEHLINKPGYEIITSAINEDKMVNPRKHIPHLDKLIPEKQKALINKKWPTEIECFTEQRDILQTILKQRPSE